MKELLRYLKDYKKEESVLGPLFKLLEASFELFIPPCHCQYRRYWYPGP